jgi:lysophospholipase L1-like esterase
MKELVMGFKAMKVLLLILVNATIGFALGVMTVQLNWMPHQPSQLFKTYFAASSQMDPPPRSVLFKTFSPKADVVMVGDSITSAGEWSEIFPDIKIANRGISGETAEDILHRMDSVFAVHPSKAFIMVGINDIYEGQSVEKIFTNYTNIVEQLLKQGIAVFIQSTIECSITRCGNRVYKVRELNQKLQAYAAQHHCGFIDLNSKLSTQEQGLLSEYTYDGMHLSAKGFVQWKTMIEPYMS